MNTQDLAIVNIPLARRGNIDAQIDRYKSEQRKTQAANRKAAAVRFRADKEAAAVLWVSGADKVRARVEAAIAKRPEFKAADMLDMIEGWVKLQPAKFLKWMAA